MLINNLTIRQWLWLIPHFPSAIVDAIKWGFSKRRKEMYREWDMRFDAWDHIRSNAICRFMDGKMQETSYEAAVINDAEITKELFG